MANEYHVAATALWIQIMDAPYLFNPISYLLRHTVELQLKGLIVSELRKDNRNLKINEIKTPAGKMNSVHSVWTLWEFYLKLSQACSIPMDEVDVKFCSNVLSKIDKKDFSSTRYRYPFKKTGATISLEPIKIDTCTYAPDLSLGIPTIVMKGSAIGAIDAYGGSQRSLMRR